MEAYIGHHRLLLDVWEKEIDGKVIQVSQRRAEQIEEVIVTQEDFKANPDEYND